VFVDSALFVGVLLETQQPVPKHSREDND
jgi:hypothetical protein